ncbi:PaaI family thioesterase [Yinghuangia sp. ASG 101]|uniref:PaaI family thioesterase n=1 Tax=Yinghuangia sp. ASG 101 TaxID=2896848 RepID=UPI001E44C696|nr:PaaI family thioesterase [Yinghuangia sp. ASG 101]UGQ11246.1 PaaI family thioesterase [Yinghuangia sp. ASG 101]
MTVTASTRLSEPEQQRRRAWFRERWEHGVRFNRECGMRVGRWDSDAVEMTLPYAEELSAHEGVFHGGVVSALIDTAGGGAVIAGHDFDKGSRLSTVSMSVQYLLPAIGPEIVAHARCVRRGSRTHFAEVEVRRPDGQVCARGQVVVNIAGERPGVGEPIEAAPVSRPR